jgi:hypothetical protein
VILDEAEALLDPVSDIESFMLACLVDASTGMVLASRKDQDDISPPTAAAGTADIANVLSQLTGELPVDGLEDVMVTYRRQLYVIRLVSPEPQILLLVILDRDQANLAMARDLAWDLSRSVFGTTIEAYRLLARQLLSVAGPRPGRPRTGAGCHVFRPGGLRREKMRQRPLSTLRLSREVPTDAGRAPEQTFSHRAGRD